MTSKEALKELSYLQQAAAKDNDLILEALDTIKKDLEVLEILKENALIQKNGDGYTITIWLNTANCGYGDFEIRENVDKVRDFLEKKEV